MSIKFSGLLVCHLLLVSAKHSHGVVMHEMAGSGTSQLHNFHFFVIDRLLNEMKRHHGNLDI